MKKPSKCASCGGTNLASRRVTRSFGARMADIVVVRDVPIIVCRDCGESFVSGATLKRVHALQRKRLTLRKAEVPVARI